MTTYPNHRFDNVRPVLVPLEPARHHSALVDAAAEVCAGLGARAVLLDLVHSPDAMQREVRICGRPVEAVLRASVGTHLEQCACAFREVGVSIDLAVREGDPVKNILAEAQGTGAQLIVMVGAGGAGGADGCDLLVDAVVRGAQVPVMVVSTEDDAPVIAPPTPVVVPLQDE